MGKRPDVMPMLTSFGLPDGLDVDRHQVDIGTTFDLTMSGAPGGVSVLTGALDFGELDLGLNRRLLLELSSFFTIGVFPRPSGTAMTTLAVPNDASLHDTGVYFQALQVDASGGLRMSSAAEIYVP